MSDKSELTTIEIKGVKMQVDLRHAVRIEELRVGSKVKVLRKNYSDHTVHAGIVVGFEPFKELPTIVIAYLDQQHSKMELKMLHYNANTKETEVVVAVDDDLEINRKDVIDYFERKRAKLRREIEEVNDHEAYFTRHFKKYWEQVKPQDEPEVEMVDADESDLPF